MEVLAIVPARSGSKSVKNKNIKTINGKPLMAYSIEHALNSKYISRVIVSTDSEQYATIAREYGAETPFIRPAEYSTDTALDYDVFRHALEWLNKNEDYCPDIVVQLRPTYPIRNIIDIDNMVKMLIDNPAADSVRSIAKAKEIAYKMWRYNEDSGEMIPLLNDIKEAYNMPRQELPTIYYQNACIDVLRPSTVLDKKSMTGDFILGYELKDNFDIDTEEDFRKADLAVRIMAGNQKYVFDIDGVIASFREDIDYSKAEPNINVINTINKIHSYGNRITLFTARGYKTGIDWKEVTQNQMDSWGVCYDELIFGKPDADAYIDDKLVDINVLIDIMGNE